MPKQAIRWTEEQLAAIQTKGGAITVSAAAGSGKTAVLVERVLRLLTDDKQPILPENLLIVTFTRAAASEMKQKIKNALRQAAQDNAVAQRALLSIDQAQISTMDAFCVKLVRENFELAGVSPDFRMLDDTENRSLCRRVLDEVLEDSYAHISDFAALSDYFLRGRNDSLLVSAVESLYEYSYSYPNPVAWLQTVAGDYADVSEIGQTIWGEYLLTYCREAMDYVISLQNRAVKFLDTDELLSKSYGSALFADLDQYLLVKEKLKNCQKWSDAADALASVASQTRLSSKKGVSALPGADAIKDLRAQIKKVLSSVAVIMNLSEQAAIQEIAAQRPIVTALTQAVCRYADALDRHKRERNAYYFGDILHIALSLLYREDGTITPLAEKLSHTYAAVLIDEYQDTTRAQDSLFTAISQNGKNMFVVGDVKQSIYGFRLATPEIFLERCQAAFPVEKEVFPAKVILSKNFRSRAGILAFVNFVFSQIMSATAGGVAYTGEEYLYYGGAEPEGMNDTDFLLTVAPDEPFEAECRRIAAYINEKVYAKTPVTVKNTERPVRFSDFCILLRTVKDKAEKMASILQEAQIPVLYEKGTDYFSLPEIRLFFSLLQIIDNPLTDVDLLSAMTSPLYGFIPDELAQLRRLSDGSLYHCLCAGAEEQTALGDKCRSFLQHIQHLRTYSQSIGVSDFVRYVMEETQFASMAAAMPGGESRIENLSFFLRYAAQYEESGGVGYSGFLRYLDRIRSQNSEVTVLESTGDIDNAVRVMSIHKSKGLEFPYVIVADLAKTFNTGDLRSFMLTDMQFGVALRMQDRSTLRNYETLPYTATKLSKKQHLISEEIRLLYVALTRAASHLVLSGSVKKLDTYLRKISALLPLTGNPAAYSVFQCSSYLDMLTLSLLRHKDCATLRDLAGTDSDILPCAAGVQLSVFEDNQQGQDIPTEQQPQKIFFRKPFTPELFDAIRKKIEYQYPFAPLRAVPAKVIASQFSEQQALDFENVSLSEPSFVQSDLVSGASRGLAYHKFLQHCDFKAAQNDLSTEMNRLLADGVMQEKEVQMLSRKKLTAFFASDVCRDILQADRVFREFAFRLLLPVRELYAIDSDEQILVQGVADLIYIKGDRAFIIDYKTDAAADPESLRHRYRPQLVVYKKAIEELLSVRVERTVLYSISASRAIDI